MYTLSDAKAQAETAAWARFAAACIGGAAGADFHAAWLALLALRIPRACAALVLLGEQEQGPFTVAAAWPDAQRELQHLGPVAQRTLAERRGVVAGPDGGELPADGAAHVGYPIDVAGRLRGAVVLDIEPGPAAELQATLRQIHWASAWLVDHHRQQQLHAAEAEAERLALLGEWMATALQHRPLHASALAMAHALAARLAADRVAIGFERQDRVTPQVLSHTAEFDARSDLARALGDAMDEVLDLDHPVALPRPAGDERGALAHEQAARVLGAQAMWSVPLRHEGCVVGVITLERQQGQPFSAQEQTLAEAAALMLGPLWALQRLNERSPWQRLLDGTHTALQTLAGPRHPGLKLGATLAAMLLLMLALWPAEHRVSARTVVEGAAQRVQVAPFDGFIAQSWVRAGDTVRLGQPMARLDDRELQLERARWAAEVEQARRKFQVAQSQADRGAMGVLAAQAQQAQAQLALVDEKLARALVTAPFDGLVVAGDLSQATGTPVTQGRTLFEVAPQQGHRVVLQVDERDIARLQPGQTGQLLLASLPEHALPFTLSTLTAVATPQDGHNVFRVEAQLQGQPARLRPGMEGIGKVVVGERSLLWIWTHGLFDALRLAVWSWLP